MFKKGDMVEVIQGFHKGCIGIVETSWKTDMLHDFLTYRIDTRGQNPSLDASNGYKLEFIIEPEHHVKLKKEE